MRLVLGIIVIGFLSGCTKPIYDWGSYEQSLHTMYTKAGQYDLAQDLDRLSVEVERTVAGDRLVPPGKLAHVGYLFYLSGDSSSARQYFEAEKRVFPEGGRFMDRMLEQLP